MTSISEKGYAMIAAHFDELLEIVLTFEYKPSQERLKPESMKILSDDYKILMNNLAKALAAYKTAVYAREPAFELMNKLVPRIINILKSLDLPEETIEAIKSIARKIQGRRATPKRSEKKKNEDVASGIDVREISSSQRSYDNQLANFVIFYEQLNSIPDYLPNETAMQKDSVHTMIQDLKQKNANVITAKTALNDARAKRNNLLYKKGSGLVFVALDAKAYIKGAFGPSSTEFKKVQKLEFRKN